jgi:mannose-6-phosphate isomerase-like protein (cupin superfamily)
LYNFSSFHIEENVPRTNNETTEEILAILQKNAELIDLYRRLIQDAPNPSHRGILFDSLQNKEFHLNQFTALHHHLTGSKPAYDIEQISYGTYKEGLDIAFQAEFEQSEDYRSHYVIMQGPHIQNALLHAFSAQRENALRLHILLSESKSRSLDKGGDPLVVDIEKATKDNDTYRTALWTGDHLQVTLMSINAGDDIGLEIHPDTDQFIRIEDGQGLVQMGSSKNNLTFQQQAYADYAVMIPAGTWHNITNTGTVPMKVYAIYSPSEHPYGTVHKTKADAMAAEG